MYLWHNHQRTLWFEGLHSEKRTHFYNLMSQNMSGSGATEALWSSMGPCENKKLMTDLSERVYGPNPSPSLTLVAVTWSWRDIWLFLLREQYRSPEKYLPISITRPTNYSMQVKFGTSWVKWYDSDRERQWGILEWLWYRKKERNQVEKSKSKTPSPTVPHL